jgi:acyl-CoA synthetase (AMP-forming)/AMP-acid ligase II
VTRTLVDLLRMRAASHADRGFAFLVGDAVTERLTYADLDREARRIAAGLAARGIARGTPALLAFPPGLDFISAFWGCIYAGVIAVPVPPPHPARLARTLPRLRAIAANADASAVLTTAALAPSLDLALPLVDIATLAGDLDAGAPGDLALLQYTSGSTRDPRGVMITHANLLHNLSLLRTFHADQEHMVMVHWLPLYHDMGLIRGMLSPLEMGGDCLMMSPLAFVEQPRRWLAALTKHRATTTGAPNFGYELAARKVTDIDAYDLSALKIAFCSAEPIRAATLERFAAQFAPCGLDRSALRPAYGLAEATVAVSGETGGGPRTFRISARALREGRIAPSQPTDTDAADAYDLVSCGRPLGGQLVAIVDEHGAPAAADRVGELCIRGPSVGMGYWRASAETLATFGFQPADGSGPYLRTGDLAWLSPGGDLCITGRKKDLIVVRGENYYPQDIETVIEEAAPSLRPGCTAAFAITGDLGETVAVVCECEPVSDWPALVASIRSAAGETLGLSLGAIAFVARGEVSKTASGKVQRALTRARFLADELAALHAWQLPTQSR